MLSYNNLLIEGMTEKTLKIHCLILNAVQIENQQLIVLLLAHHKGEIFSVMSNKVLKTLKLQ